MKQILKVKDQVNLVPTSKFPFAKFPYENFNQVQSRAFESYDQDVNYVAAIKTGTGKTLIAEMFLADSIRKNKQTGLYLAPSRSLSQERTDDWKDPKHHFSDLNISICTGDYKLTSQRKQELSEANLIVMTSELLNSRARNYRSENNQFLKSVGTLVLDEGHSLSMKDRGSHIESALMKFTEINPKARLVLLSATLPNVDEIGGWLSKLNGKTTVVLESSYRSCPLNIHYVKYQDVQWGYEENERSKIREAIKIVKAHPNDKFILFVHTKRTGEWLMSSLQDNCIEADLHNADLSKEKRIKVETSFKNNPKLRCIVATSTLAAGINMPARRVIIVGVHRGLSEVDVFDIDQSCGRAGRPQFDPQGDAYILLPERSFDKHKKRLQTPQLIQSQMSDGKGLAFHITSDIHHKNIQSMEDVHDWYDRSLAHHQSKELEDEVVTEVINNLTRCGAVKEESNCYETTTIGNVASMFYFSPFDVSDLSRNWSKVFEQEEQYDDHWVSMALANIDSMRMSIASNADKEEMEKFRKGIQHCERILSGSREFTDGAIKCGCCYYNLLKGYNVMAFNSIMQGLKKDFERTNEVLSTLDQMTGKWGQKDYFKRLHVRILYGVPDEMVDLISLKNIGKIKAKRLWDANLRSWDQISNNVLGVIKALNCSKNVAQNIANNAKELLLS